MEFDKIPGKVGLYDPSYEKDACGVGFIVNIGKDYIYCRMFTLNLISIYFE